MRNVTTEFTTLQSKGRSLCGSLPVAPHRSTSSLLFLDFIGSFPFAFVEPRMVYDVLDWSTIQFGLVIGASNLTTPRGVFAVAMALILGTVALATFLLRRALAQGRKVTKMTKGLRWKERLVRAKQETI
ncbi:MAG: hypothetical protein M3220_13020 [Chloroflexota bacterium]|nr:hypothetical protein [Chloroflexota bacterium]